MDFVRFICFDDCISLDWSHSYDMRSDLAWMVRLRYTALYCWKRVLWASLFLNEKPVCFATHCYRNFPLETSIYKSLAGFMNFTAPSLTHLPDKTGNCSHLHSHCFDYLKSILADRILRMSLDFFQTFMSCNCLIQRLRLLECFCFIF